MEKLFSKLGCDDATETTTMNPCGVYCNLVSSFCVEAENNGCVQSPQVSVFLQIRGRVSDTRKTCLQLQLQRVTAFPCNSFLNWKRCFNSKESGSQCADTLTPEPHNWRKYSIGMLIDTILGRTIHPRPTN